MLLMLLVAQLLMLQREIPGAVNLEAAQYANAAGVCPDIAKLMTPHANPHATADSTTDSTTDSTV